MVRKNRQRRKAKIKVTRSSSEEINKIDNDESMDDPLRSDDNEKPTIKIEYVENTAETSDFCDENVKFSCAVSI